MKYITRMNKHIWQFMILYNTITLNHKTKKAKIICNYNNVNISFIVYN